MNTLKLFEKLNIRDIKDILNLLKAINSLITILKKLPRTKKEIFVSSGKNKPSERLLT